MGHSFGRIPREGWTELADELEHLLGRHVDLVNPRYIRNPYLVRAVNERPTLIYGRQNAKTADWLSQLLKTRP